MDNDKKIAFAFDWCASKRESKIEDVFRWLDFDKCMFVMWHALHRTAMRRGKKSSTEKTRKTNQMRKYTSEKKIGIFSMCAPNHLHYTHRKDRIHIRIYTCMIARYKYLFWHVLYLLKIICYVHWQYPKVYHIHHWSKDNSRSNPKCNPH